MRGEVKAEGGGGGRRREKGWAGGKRLKGVF